jgi:hypothetical protein
MTEGCNVIDATQSKPEKMVTFAANKIASAIRVEDNF